jgi:hypothetical protein
MNELWQEICFTLQDIPQHSNESYYEQKIIQSLEKLGWSRFKNEIVLKKNIQIGSSGRIIPDIIVKSLENNKSFVIEVKKPSVDVENKSHKRQLFSYMRQLKLANGLLIGNKIQIYYDGVHNYNVSKAPILLKSIEISELDKNGTLLIDLFHKNSFSYDNLDYFAKKTIKEISIKRDKEKLYNLLLSSEYKDKVLQFISNDLQQNWNSDTIDNVLTQLSLSINRKNTELLQSVPTATNLNPLHYNQAEVIIGKLVQSYISTILNLGANEIEKLKNKEYSKSTFNINYPFLQKVTSNEPVSNKERYYVKQHTVNNYCYVVCSEWFKGSIPLFKAYIAKMKL